MFLDRTGEPLSYFDAVTSGRSTGVPGAVAMLGRRAREFGRLPWHRLFDAPIRAAEAGFAGAATTRPVCELRLSRRLRLPMRARCSRKSDGTIVKAGDDMRNPQYAATLRTIAAQGPRALLEQPLARADRRTHARRSRVPAR